MFYKRTTQSTRKYKILDEGKSNSKDTGGEREHEALQDQVTEAQMWAEEKRW